MTVNIDKDDTKIIVKFKRTKKTDLPYADSEGDSVHLPHQVIEPTKGGQTQLVSRASHINSGTEVLAASQDQNAV